MRTSRSGLSSYLRHLVLAAVLVNLPAVHSAHADTLIGPLGGSNATLPGSSPLLVQGPMCVGGNPSPSCATGEIFDFGVTMKIKDTRPILKFEDSTAPVNSHTHWFLMGNPTRPNNNDTFTIFDFTNLKAPFGIQANSPDNALYIGPNAVGFGTDTPIGNGTSIHIFGDATSDVFSGVGPNPNTGPAFNFGYSGHSFERSSGFFNIRPDAAALAPNPSLRFATANVQRMIIDNLGNVGIGQFGATASPPNRGTSPQAKLHVQGTILAQGNITTTTGFFFNATQLNVPDYVFDPHYNLLPLKQLAAYVEKEKHLPDVPSAQDIKVQGGINLGDMQLTLLKKIEELTLYTLQQEGTIQNQGKTISTQSKTISTLRQANKAQQDALAALAARVEALERVQSAAQR